MDIPSSDHRTEHRDRAAAGGYGTGVADTEGGRLGVVRRLTTDRSILTG